MKSFDSRAYSINDFVEWDRQGHLQLNPAFQRRPVWSDKAKSYLIDTILRGKPIPKVFIRQKINVTTKASIREVVDGQQRLRTILSYVKDGFPITRKQHPEYGGMRFSQLPEDVQSQFLSFEIAVDLLINLPDAEILDIFARLNSYAVILNEQEKINSTHFSAFKVLADTIGFRYNEYWKEQRILTAQQILRMQEVNLVADILIATLEGIKSKKQIKRFYAKYEKEFENDVDEIAIRFSSTIDAIGKIYPEGLSDTEFRRNHLFYSLFTVVFHSLYSLQGLDAKQWPLETDADFQAVRNALDRVGGIYAEADAANLTKEERQFLQDTRRATTDEAVRERRAKFLLNLIG